MAKRSKKQQLSAQDIQSLKYQCRPGFIFAMFIIILGVGYLLIYNYTSANQLTVIMNVASLLIFLGVIVVALSIGFVFMRKYLIDIRNAVKIIEYKKISKKECVVMNEAGSGSAAVWQKMKAVEIYSVIIEQRKYHVDKQLFDSCTEGEIVEFHVAPKSGFRLQITANVLFAY